MTAFAPGGGTVADPVFAFDAFDPSLGTLTRVDVSIQGMVTVNAVLSGSQACTFAGCIPVPYEFGLTIGRDYGLEFLSPGPEIRYLGISSGFDTTVQSTTTYSHSMSFTETTDLLGFAPVASSAVPGAPIGSLPLVTPAVGAARDRSDFVSPIPGAAFPLVFLFPVLEFSAHGQGLQGPFHGSILSGGTIMLTYIFEEPVVPAPEPVAGFLIALGLVLLRWKTAV
jgi:hypothetical protein